ncbi:MAG: hypothetical protein CMJ78_02715 [Planctomycetaceae bacterium]|nr:hypothetical protein [Planctomycetaceae bacterium]
MAPEFANVCRFDDNRDVWLFPFHKDKIGATLMAESDSVSSDQNLGAFRQRLMPARTASIAVYCVKI